MSTVSPTGPGQLTHTACAPRVPPKQSPATPLADRIKLGRDPSLLVRSESCVVELEVTVDACALIRVPFLRTCSTRRSGEAER